MTIQFSNNAQTTLAGAITNTALTVALSPGSGALFPALSAGQTSNLTFVDAATGLINEIVKCTAISGDTLTIVRAQDGTTAKSWLAGDFCALQVTAGDLNSFAQISDLQSNRFLFSQDTGTANSYIVAHTPPILSAVDGMQISFNVGHSNTGASTLTIDGLVSAPILGMGNAALQGSELFAGGNAILQYEASSASWVLLECPGGSQQLASGAYGVTPPLSDASTKFQTTAGALATGLTYGPNAGLALTTSTALTLAQLGGWGQFQAGSLTVTAPLLSTARIGSTITLLGGSTGGTFKGAGSDLIQPEFGTAANTYVVSAGQTVEFTSDGASGWFVTKSGRAAQSIGVGQTWQNVTGSRVAGTTYTNGTSTPIQVILEASAVLSVAWSFTVGGVTIQWIGAGSVTGITGTTSFIVPAGVTYSASGFSNWYELR